MREVYESYKGSTKLSPMVREINWAHNLIIFFRTKTDEEREFYLKSAFQE
jgi:predicted nuclease of restriction endonuclease-like (RecB) superfamily